MHTKLTLRVEESLISSAKRYSAKSGKSLSQLVADYFALIESGAGTSPTALSPRVQALYGALAGTPLDEADHRRHLEDKHR